jgi:hypothetical protein
VEQALRKPVIATVDVESISPMLSPISVTLPSVECGLLIFLNKVTKGASNVNSHEPVPTSALIAAARGFRGPLPNGTWQSKAVFVLHATERQTVEPSCNVGEVP